MGVATEKLRESGVTLSCNQREKEEVATLYETALAASARGIREPHDIEPVLAALACGGISVAWGGVRLARLAFATLRKLHAVHNGAFLFTGCCWYASRVLNCMESAEVVAVFPAPCLQ